MLLYRGTTQIGKLLPFGIITMANAVDGCSCSNTVGPMGIRSTGAELRQIRHLWMFKHVYQPERAPEGQQQRKPSEHPDLMKYQYWTSREFRQKAPPIKVILLRKFDKLGDKYDVVEFKAEDARRLILEKKVCYASPFDLEYYGKKKEELMASQKDLPVSHVPIELGDLAKRLNSKVIPLVVSQSNPWTMSTSIVSASLEREGLYVPFDHIHLAAGPQMEGPRLEEEARLIRFYVVLEDKMIVPMTGRITHISLDEDQNLFPEDKSHGKIRSRRMSQHGLRPESPFYCADRKSVV